LDRADQAMLAMENRTIASEIEDRIRQFDECFAKRITPEMAVPWVEWYKRLRIDTENFLESRVSREARLRFRAAKPTGSESYDHAIDHNHKSYLSMIHATKTELQKILAERRQ
jgi:hypothetical protein